MFKHLLVPLDGSGLAEMALAPAMELARPFESEITLIRIVRPPQIAASTSGGVAYGEVVTELRGHALAEAETYLKNHQGSLRQQGYKVHIHVAEGERIAEILLDTIESLQADTIVMSTHGRGGLSRWVFGSVADKVLRRASVPVLLVRALEATES